MSASVRPQANPGSGFVWTEAELARAKQLVSEGYTHGTVAGFLRQEFGTDRSGLAVQKMFSALRLRSGASVKAQLVTANTRRRPCLTCRAPFDSEGPHNHVCMPCKQWVWREIA